MRVVRVCVEGNAYTAVVGQGLLSQLGEYCAGLGLGQRVAILSDPQVAQRYMRPVVTSLRNGGFDVVEAVFPGNDTAKNLQTAEDIFGALIAAELDRTAWICAVGGGVVGDMAGFVAATFLRGIDFVQVPTTIVGQVDASIGGKTAVNHRLGKNLIGAFHHPRMVLVDTDALGSLPRRELVGGLAEVVKHAVIADAEMFDFLEDCIDEVVTLSLNPDQLDWLIARNIKIKANVVAADEKDNDVRAILNYGHTIGHAIEAESSYSRFRHGEAVILGMLAAGHLALTRGMWSAAARQRQDKLLDRLGIPSGLSEASSADIVRQTRRDKKRARGKLKFVLPTAIGSATVVDGVSEAEVAASLEIVRCAHP